MVRLFLLLGITSLYISVRGQSYYDSLLVYNAYNGNIEALEKATNFEKWYALEDSLKQVTVGALNRLRIENQATYQPMKKYEREGFGVANLYPKPVSPPRKMEFTILDKQTKFVVDDDGKTRIPYVELRYFDEASRLKRVERLDPVTFELASANWCRE